MGTADGVDEFKDGKFIEIIKFDKGRHMRFQSTNSVFSLTAYNNEAILAGTYRGVYKITGDKYQIITVKDGLLSDYVNYIMVTKDKSIVYGYHNKGISIERNGEFDHFTTENGLSNNAITHICERSDGAILVGTELGGLNIIKDGKIDTVTTDNGLSSNEIRAVTEDNLGNVYVSTPNGLNILSFEKQQINCRQISKLDGLASNNCSQNALFVDQDNNLWIGTSNGLNKYNPIFDRPSTTAPSIYLTGFEIFNKPFPLEKFFDNPTLDYNQNYLNFSFAGINAPNNHKIVYQYRLSGVDNDWVTSRSDHVQYTSLDDGQYTFEVKARNEWGFWSEPASLSFVIDPAWWETWWFYTLAFLAIGSLIAFLSSYRYRHLLSVEKMRTKISADLHDSVGSGLSEISILSELLGAQVNEEKNDFKSGLNNISTISRSLIESMSDIVWLVNPKKDTLKDLFKRLQLSYHEVLKYSDIDLLVENLDELENVRLPMNFRQHIYLIFKEAINNAIKYSSGDLLTLKIETSGNNLKVIFSDNGKGFELNSEKMGNGLINMKNRAKEIGGDINYFSEINKGTKVIFEGKFQKQKTSFI
jgi:two-component sensor histidine kinase